MIHKDRVHNSHYTTIHNRALEDTRLSLKATGLLASLLAKPPNWKVCKEQLMKAHTDGRKSVNSAFDELVEFGYLQMEGDEWGVYETPIPPHDGPTECAESTSEGNMVQKEQCSKGTSENVQKVHHGCPKGTSDHVRKVHLISTHISKKVSTEGIPPSLPTLSEERMNESLINDSYEKDSIIYDHSSCDPSKLNEQAATVLKHFPNKKHVSYAIPDVKRAIQEKGYGAVLAATKLYVAEIEETGRNPSQAAYWYGAEESHYLRYLPEPDEPFVPREFVTPPDITPELEEIALQDMQDTVTSTYLSWNPKYVYKQTDAAHFKEAARICFYNELNPYQFVCSNLRSSGSTHKPQLLHADHSVNKASKENTGASVSNVPFCCDYLSREIASYDAIVAGFKATSPSLDTGEILLTSDSTKLPAWYRVVACPPDDPKWAEIIERWLRQGIYEIYAQQLSGIVEALFSLEGIEAAILFPYYAVRYANVPKYELKLAVENNPVVEAVERNSGLERGDQFSEWHQRAKGSQPTLGATISTEDCMAFLSS